MLYTCKAFVFEIEHYIEVLTMQIYFIECE